MITPHIVGGWVSGFFVMCVTENKVGKWYFMKDRP